MNKEEISDILFKWESDISSGAGHNHRDSVAKQIIELCQKEQLEKVVLWALNQGFATGHADTIESLLEEISLDIAELRRRDVKTGGVPQIKEWGSKGSPF